MNPLLFNKKILEDLIIETAQYFDMPQVYIEKDFHVYLMLKSLAKSPYADSVIFKGGTALSRIWKITDRFSEDVDICVNPTAKNSFSQLKIEKDFISKSVELEYPKIDQHEDEIKGGTRRKTVHPFPKIIVSSEPQLIKENIILEVTAVKPSRIIGCSKQTITSYIGDFLSAISLVDVIKEYDLNPVELAVMLPEYTLADKLCRIVKEAHKQDSEEQLGLKIRDLYDIHKLLKNKNIREIFYSESFAKIFYDTVLDEQENNNEIHKFSDTLLFSNPSEVLALQKENYKKFKILVYFQPPELSDIIKTLENNFARLKELDSIRIRSNVCSRMAEKVDIPKPQKSKGRKM